MAYFEDEELMFWELSKKSKISALEAFLMSRTSGTLSGVTIDSNKSFSEFLS